MPLQHNSIIDGRMVPLKMQNRPVDQQALKDCSKQRGMLRNKSMADKANGKTAKKPPPQDFNDPREKKKIDFKEKALKSKENSIKKVVAKSNKTSGGKGPSTGGG